MASRTDSGSLGRRHGRDGPSGSGGGAKQENSKPILDVPCDIPERLMVKPPELDLLELHLADIVEEMLKDLAVAADR